uniref:Transmembrane 9 superfamily member n=1 Tax=Trypanosoma vivax (strain Y486) TaxID=1055687 RepID=G0UAN9_TRYVY|nr:putative endomembrane protein, fragment [Trypanosoma vivax Y486]
MSVLSISCSRKLVQLLLFAVVLAGCAVQADEESNTYVVGEEVYVYGNKIRPLRSPFEVYDFFSVPGCPPLSWVQKSPSFGRMLLGDRMYRMNMKLQFELNTTNEVMCTFTPTEAHLKRWRKMIKRNFVYQLVVDDLPASFMFGATQSGNPAVYTHYSLRLGVNSNRIVSVAVESRGPEPVEVGRVYTFTYGVQFIPSNIPFNERLNSYLGERLLNLRFRWVSIANSFLINLFLIAAVAIILLRTQRGLLQPADSELSTLEGGDGIIEGTGWKQLAADVHRVPHRAELFCALLGTGAQLCCVASLTIFATVVNGIRQRSIHGVVTLMLAFYLLTGLVAGFVSATQLMRYSALNPSLLSNWFRCMQVTLVFFPTFIVLCGFFTNVVARIYHSSRAVHLGGLTFVMFLLFLVYCPAVTIGSLLGRYFYRRSLILLNTENHYWQWMSFWFGASSGIYMYLYAIYFYFFRSISSGFFTLVFFFAYSTVASLAVGLIGGFVAFLSSLVFVKKVYAAVKTE